jgi:ribonuclease HIII
MGVGMMANTVLKLTKHEMNKIKNSYSTYLQPKNPPGSLFVAKLPNCTVTAYQTGKVLFQGKDAEIIASKWGKVEASKSSTTNKKGAFRGSNNLPHQYAPPDNIAQLSIIGSDEAGTGDYFGPMTVAATFVNEDQFQLVKELGVKDSKLLNDQQISEIAQKLIKVVPYSLLILHNPKYNELQQKGYNQGKMKAFLHNKTLHNVVTKINGTQCDGVLIDQFCEPGVYFNYLKGQEINLPNLYFKTKAESAHLSVAAASIIARYAFVREMDKLSEQAGLTLPKGASAAVDQVAAKIIQSKGVSVLNTFAKVHFANTQKANAFL